MIHLMIGRVTGNGGTRFVSKDDYDESEEALVVKLSKIIKTEGVIEFPSQ